MAMEKYRVAAQPNDSQLTLILPTHNRPRHAAAQLRFFKACGLRHHIVVADSSDPAEAEAMRAACTGIADYRRFDPVAPDKLLTTVRSVQTPFVVMAPDDDIAFPHAIDAALEYLARHPDHVAAHGYTLRFGLQGNDVDIHSVYSFVPSIDHDDPLERHYDLMRRYQPFYWAVFRREILVSAPVQYIMECQKRNSARHAFSGSALPGWQACPVRAGLHLRRRH